MTADDINALACRLESARSQFDLDMYDQTSVCAMFGVYQERLAKAGWKRWYPDTCRWGSSLRPASSLDDLRCLLENAGCLPDTLNSKPWLAAAEAIRAISPNPEDQSTHLTAKEGE